MTTDQLTHDDLDELQLIRQCPAYHLARVILERQQPFRPVLKPNWPVKLSHLSRVVGIVYGARINPATWAVAFADLGVRVTLDKRDELEAQVCESLVLDWMPQTWGERRATECYGDRFAHFSDMPVELERDAAAPTRH